MSIHTHLATKRISGCAGRDGPAEPPAAACVSIPRERSQRRTQRAAQARSGAESGGGGGGGGGSRSAAGPSESGRAESQARGATAARAPPPPPSLHKATSPPRSHVRVGRWWTPAQPEPRHSDTHRGYQRRSAATSGLLHHARGDAVLHNTGRNTNHL